MINVYKKNTEEELDPWLKSNTYFQYRVHNFSLFKKIYIMHHLYKCLEKEF